MSSKGRGGFTDQEVYRLKKTVSKMRQKLYNEKDADTQFAPLCAFEVEQVVEGRPMVMREKF